MLEKGGIMAKRKGMRGFTLVELVVVMIIVGILAIISVPMYRNYVQRARSSEGRALVGSIASAERVFFTEFGSFLAVANTNLNATLGVDSRNNTYFQTFTVTVDNTTPEFTATTRGTGDAAPGGVPIVVTLHQGAAGGPTVTTTGPGF